MSVDKYPSIFSRQMATIVYIVPNFKTARVAKTIWRVINTVASIWGETVLGYLSLDIICSSKLTFSLVLRSWKAVRFSEQIMSANKYPSIFSRQMEAIVYIYMFLLELILLQFVKKKEIATLTVFRNLMKLTYILTILFLLFFLSFGFNSEYISNIQDII